MGWTDTVDETPSVQPKSAGGWTDIPDPLAFDATKIGDTKDVVSRKGKAGRSPMYANPDGGPEVEKHFGQLASAQVPLSEDPIKKRRMYGQQLTQSPQYREQMANFIRKEGKRDIPRELINATPFLEPIADTYTGGVYNNPIHPERTVESTLGFKPTEGVVPSALNAVNRAVTDPQRWINKAAYGAAGLGQSALETAAGLDKEKTLSKFAKENIEPVKTATGLADVEEAYKTGKTDFTFPKARAAYEEDLVNTAVIGKMGLEGMKTGARALGKGWDFAGEFNPMSMKPDQARFTRMSAEMGPKMATASAKGSKGTRRSKEMDAAYAAVDADMLANKDLIHVEDSDGNRVDLPRDRVTRADFINQGEQLVFNEFDRLMKETNVNVPLQPVIKWLDDFITDPTNKSREAAPLVEAAKAAKAEYEQYLADGYTPSAAQHAIKIANDNLKSAYGQPSSEAAKAVIGKGAATALRKSLDKTISEFTGEEYQPLKNKYGAYAKVSEDAATAALRQRNQPIGSVDFSDVYSMSKLALAVAKADPAIAAGATAGWLVKKMSDKYKPDRVVADTYKKLDKLLPKKPYVEEPLDYKVTSRPRYAPNEQKRLYGSRAEGELSSGQPKQLTTPPSKQLEAPSVEGEVINKPIVTPYTPKPQVVEGEYTPVNQKALEWADDPAKLDPRLTVDGAFEEFYKAQEAGDKPAADFWEGKMKDAMKKTKTKGVDSTGKLYEGTTGIFKMLQEEIKKEGGKATGIGKVALKYGVPAALLAKFLLSDDDTRKSILKKYPKLNTQKQAI